MTITKEEKVAEKALALGDYDKAVSLLLPLAEQNSRYALLSLGWIFEGGAIGTLDLDAAKRYYSRAINAGSVSACFELGRLLVRLGEEFEARSVFELGCGKHDVACMSRLGRMMVEGRGGPINVDDGMQWLYNAARQGQLSAQRTLVKIEQESANTIKKKFFVKLKLAKLLFKTFIVLLKDQHSNTVR